MGKATRVQLLDGGSLVIDQSHITWNVGCGTPVRFPVYSVLIEHPDGLFLFDSGYDVDVVNEKLAFEQPQQTADQTLPGQLAIAGRAPGDVTAIISSHLHFDHCGGHRHLPDAMHYVHVDEVREARSPEPFERLGYADTNWDHGGPMTLLSGDVELADGLHLFHTPGHTIGHYSLLVELEDAPRPLMFMADVSYTPAAYENEQQAGFHWNPVAGVRSIRRIRQLVRQWDAELFFTHDMQAYETYKRAPDGYGA